MRTSLCVLSNAEKAKRNHGAILTPTIPIPLYSLLPSCPYAYMVLYIHIKPRGRKSRTVWMCTKYKMCLHVNAFLKSITLYDYVLIKFILGNHSAPSESSSPNASSWVINHPNASGTLKFPRMWDFRQQNRANPWHNWTVDHSTTTGQTEKKRSHSWNRNSQLPRLIDKERSFKLWDVFVSHGFLSSHSQPGILRFERTNNHIDYIRNKFIAVACYLLRDFFPWTLKCLLKNNHLRLEMTLISQHLQVIELTVNYQHTQPGIKSFCFLIG